jgi:uncharacterized membrane protein
MIPRRVLFLLLSVAAVLPIAICVTLAVHYLLAAMQDDAGANLVGGGLLTAEIVVWIVDLIALVLALAVNAISDQGPDS